MCFPAAANPATSTNPAAPPSVLGMSASTVGGIGTGLQLAGMVTGVIGAYKQSKATKQAYAYQAAVERNNATIAEWQAQDAITRGGRAVQAHKLGVAQLRGSQRATMAARGIALDEGSPLAILQDTDFMDRMDTNTIKDNAAREAWGHRMQAKNYTADAGLLSMRANAESPGAATFGTLLTGGGMVADSWYNRQMWNTYRSPAGGR